MKIRIAFIGTGGIASAHMERLAKIPEAEFAAMCDIEETRARKAAATYGGKAYSDYHKMLEETEVDACYICIPPFAHSDQELLCIEKNIPFFVEKPIHLDLEKAGEIADKIREKNLLTAAGYVLRYYDIVEEAREIISQEQIALVRGKYFGEVPGAGKGWYSKKELSGGQLIEQATHIVDLMRYLLGDIAEVFAYKFAGINNKIYPGYDVEDASTTLLKFKNGIIGNLSCSWLWKGFDSGLEVMGKGFMLNYQGNCLAVEKNNTKTLRSSDADPMLEEERAFLSAIRENKPEKIKSDYPDALKTLAVTIQIHRSFQEERPVRLS